MNWGKAVLIVREKEGITQQELADKIGISRVALSEIERDKRRPNADTLEQLAVALNTQPVFIYLIAIDPETDMTEENRARFNKLFPNFHEKLLTFLE